MTAAPFTQAQVVRALKAARSVDPGAVVEVTADGTIRILPAQAVPVNNDDPFALVDMKR